MSHGYVDDKRKKLERQLSGRQKEGLMLQVMREDVQLKRQLLAQDESKDKSNDALMMIADSMKMLSQAIMAGFQQMNTTQPQQCVAAAPQSHLFGRNYASHMQRQDLVPDHISQFIPQPSPNRISPISLS